jgi:hypothetical protein
MGDSRPSIPATVPTVSRSCPAGDNVPPENPRGDWVVAARGEPVVRLNRALAGAVETGLLVFRVVTTQRSLRNEKRTDSSCKRVESTMDAGNFL